MEDPFRECRPLVRRFHRIAVIFTFIALAGGILGFAVMFASLSGNPLPGWIPLAPRLLVVVGIVICITGACGAYLFRGMTHQVERMITGPVLARWSYPEREWDLMQAAETGKAGKPVRTLFYLILVILIPVLLIVMTGVSSGIGTASLLIFTMVVDLIMIAGGTMLILMLVARYRSHQGKHVPRQVIIAPTALLKGNFLVWFSAPSLRSQEGNTGSLFSGLSGHLAETGTIAVLGGVLLRKEGLWFLDFYMTTLGEFSRSITVPILVPPGEEQTAEQVRAFFGGTVVRKGETKGEGQPR